jgi:hypothetical protein
MIASRDVWCCIAILSKYQPTRTARRDEIPRCRECRLAAGDSASMRRLPTPSSDPRYA